MTNDQKLKRNIFLLILFYLTSLEQLNSRLNLELKKLKY